MAQSQRENTFTAEELMQRIQQLEQEKAAATELATSYKDQYEALKSRGPAVAEMSTTTTKPTLRFAVVGPSGEAVFDVVDESEAKRLYFVKHKLEPSLFLLRVTCLDVETRNSRILEQYEKAGAPTERVPGVNLGV